MNLRFLFIEMDGSKGDYKPHWDYPCLAKFTKNIVARCCLLFTRMIYSTSSAIINQDNSVTSKKRKLWGML